MSTLFLSYRSTDEVRALKLADALRSHGFNVWRDGEQLVLGENWRSQIEQALVDCDVLLVLWPIGANTEDTKWVRYEALVAHEQGKLLQATFGRGAVPPSEPIDFSALQSANLTHWPPIFGAAQDPVVLDVVAAIKAKVAGTSPPAPKGRLALLRQRILAGFGGACLVGGGGGFGMDVYNVQAMACTAGTGAFEAAISDSCGALRLGDRPTKDERLAYAAIKPNTPQTCTQLRAFVATYNDSSVSDLPAQADRRISARISSRFEEWTPSADEAVINESRAPLSPSPTIAAAQAAARAEIQRDAPQTCETTGVPNEKRANMMNSIDVKDYNCPPDPRSGYTCSARYIVTCGMEERAVVETCN
jgi:hypothetical protein